MALIPMKCVSCGGALEIGPDMESFSCGYCGTALFVERRGGTVSLKVVVEGLKAVQAGTDKTAAELALKRLDGELTEIRGRQAVLHKLRSESERNAGWLVVIGGFSLLLMYVSAWWVLLALLFWFFAYEAYPSGEHFRKQLAPLEEQEKAILQEIERNQAIVRS